MNDNRYIRQTLLDRIGEEGQLRLANAIVAIVGCGGLGSIAAPYLAGAGIGHLILIDGDTPDITNLHRQVFFSAQSAEKTKSQYLAQHIHQLNPTIQCTTHEVYLTKTNIDDLLSSADVVLECTDHIQAKYLVNDYCYLNHIPMVYGAIHKYDGFVSFFENKDYSSIHLRDIFPTPSSDIPSCSEVGVLGTLAGMIGLFQANEAIKYLTYAGTTLVGTLLSYDILTNNQMKLKLKKAFFDKMEEVYDNSNYEMGISCDVLEISAQDLRSSRSDFVLVSILEDHEHENLDSDVVRMPISAFDIEYWKPTVSKPHVFYCISGKRSAKLVSQLKINNNSDVDLLSLSGGLQMARRN